MASSSSRNASISAFVSAPVAVPFGAPFIPAIAPFAPASALPAPDSAPLLLCLYLHLLPLLLCLYLHLLLLYLYLTRRGYLLLPHSTEKHPPERLLMQIFFNAASFSAVSAVSSASVSAPIRCSEPAAIACGCHSHVFHINIADNAAAKIRFDFFSYHFPPTETNLRLLTTRKRWESSRLR